MKIKKINITNIKSIDNLELSLMDENTGKPHNVLLLVGENGTGKTTILQSIASCFTCNRSKYEGKMLDYDDVAKTKPFAAISLDLKLNSLELNHYGKTKKHRIEQVIVKEEVKFKHHILKKGNEPFYQTEDYQTLNDNMSKFREEPLIGGYVLFFDAYRIVSDLRINGPSSKIPDSPIDGALMPSIVQLTYHEEQFHSDRFQHTKQWIVNLDYKEAKLYRERQEDSGLFNRVIQAFNLLLSPYTFSRVSNKSEILFSTPSGEIEVGFLSDGMKSIFSMIGDILFRFSLPYMDKDDIDVDAVLNTEAIVLVDEIDCHLHPKWQLNIIPAMRSLFPNVQFIMTTHSPLIVKSVNPDEIIKLGGWSDDGDKTAQ
jgi:predicted ATP-binding protein involved in virulence